MDGWYGRIYRGCGFLTDKPIAKFTKKQLDDLLYKEPTKIKVDGINVTYEGLIPKIGKSMLTRTVRPCSRTSGRSSTAPSPSRRARSARAHAGRGARSSKIKGISIADAFAMQISDLAEW